MNFGEAISDGFSKYAEFNGRSSRSAYWWWLLFNFLVIVAASIIDAVIEIPVFTAIVLLGLVIPDIAITVRRLHDFDQTGWLVLICVLPFAGFVATIVFGCIGSSPGPNKYGPGPDGKAAAAPPPYPGQTYAPPAPPAPPAPQAPPPPPPAPSTGDTPPPPPPPQA